MNPLDSIHAISLDTAAVLTGLSKRTWQRRIEDGKVPRLADGRGRTLVPFESIAGFQAVAGLDEDDVQTLVRADEGDAVAQAEIGAFFALCALREAAPAKPTPGAGLRQAASPENARVINGARAQYYTRISLPHASGRAAAIGCDALAGHAACGRIG